MKLLRELGHYLQGWALDCRKSRQYATLTEVQAVQDITAEASAEQAELAGVAHRARVADDEAAGLIDQVLADGQVTAREIPLLRKARRHVGRSAEADHNLAEGLTS